MVEQANPGATGIAVKLEPWWIYRLVLHGGVFVSYSLCDGKGF